MGNTSWNPFEVGKQISSDIKEGMTNMSNNISNSINVAVNGMTYNVSKAVDTIGNSIITITRQLGDTTTTIFKDTERNAFLFLGNTMQNLTNAYVDTEQNIVFGIQSPLEKTLHIADDQLDQLQMLLYDAIHNIISTMQMSAVIIFIVVLLAFLFLAKKEYIMKILDMIQKVVNKFL